MRFRNSFLVIYAFFMIAVCSAEEKDSAKANSSVFKGLSISLNFYEEFLKTWADCLKGESFGDSIAHALGLEGAKLPWGVDCGVLFGGGFSSKIRFPIGYSYMRCMNPGKDKESFLKTSRHIIFGGVLIYLNDFKKEKIVPFISGSAGYFIYTLKFSYNTETVMFGKEIGTLVGDLADNQFSYYLNAGLVYCIDEKAGIGAGINFNGAYNDLSFSITLMTKH